MASEPDYVESVKDSTSLRKSDETSVQFEDHPWRRSDLPSEWLNHYSHIYYREASGKLLRLSRAPSRGMAHKVWVVLEECFEEPVPVEHGRPWSSHTGHFLDNTFQPYHTSVQIHEWILDHILGEQFYINAARDMEAFLRQMVVDVL